MRSNKELRLMARMKLKGNWKRTILACFIVTAISIVISSIVNGVGNDNKFLSFLSLFTGLITIPLTLGLAIFFLKFVRNENPKLANLFDGFKVYLKCIGLNIMVVIFTFLWSAFFIVLFIVTFFTGSIFLIIASTVLLFLALTVIGMRYSQVNYILSDNDEIGILEIIRASKEMMKGNSSKLILLYLSFLGWAILGIITLLIGYIWLIPYVNTTMALFYEEINGRDKFINIEE